MRSILPEWNIRWTWIERMQNLFIIMRHMFWSNWLHKLPSIPVPE
jgi:hypothetical protein